MNKLYKKIKTSFVLLLVLSSTISFAQVPAKVLFIGNSITYFNDMPVLFESIANEKGKNIDIDMYAPGGIGFANHVVDNNVYNLFRNNIWDVVILQPGSGESPGVSWPASTTAQRGIQMMDSIKKYSPCAKIFLYEIPYGITNASAYNTFFQVQNQIKDTITRIADLMKIPLVAAGECARNHYSKQQDLLLHSSYNDIHPNLNGSYLVACAMYCAIYQEPVSGVLFRGGVVDSTAKYFHSITDSIILQNKTNWRINTYNLHASFADSIIGSNLINFTNLSTNYNSVLWDFGDGTTSSIINPQHQYLISGNKIVTLTATSNGCTETFTKTISAAMPLGWNNLPMKTNMYIYPNPATTILFVKQDSPNEIAYKIVSSIGQEVLSGSINKSKNKINVSSICNGLYYLQCYDNNRFIGQIQFLKNTK